MRPGFTLVELLVVIAIMSVVSAVTVPALIQAGTNPATEAVATIAKVLEAARTSSDASGHSSDVTIATKTHSYWVHDGSGEIQTRDTLELGSGVTLSARNERVNFRFRPTRIMASDTLLVHAGSATSLIWIDGYTGAIRTR